MHYMYDSAYGKIVFGQTSGLTPYYKFINQLFRYTLAAKAGNSDKISNMSKNLLAKMTPGATKFSVFDFLWEQIIYTSISPKRGCHYAPYIFFMIKEMAGINILADQNHLVYKPSKGTLDRLLQIGSHAPPRWTQGQSSSQAPGSSYDPYEASLSSSRGPPRAPTKKKGILNFISQGLFACFNIRKHNAEEICAHRQYVDEQLLKIQTR